MEAKYGILPGMMQFARLPAKRFLLSTFAAVYFLLCVIAFFSPSAGAVEYGTDHLVDGARQPEFIFMTVLSPSAAFSQADSSADKIRLCPLRDDKNDPRRDEAWDEIEDVAYEYYYEGVKYFEGEIQSEMLELAMILGKKEKLEKGDYNFGLFVRRLDNDYAISFGQAIDWHTQKIHAYTLKQRALLEYKTVGKGAAVKEFCDYLKTLYYHP